MCISKLQKKIFFKQKQTLLYVSRKDILYSVPHLSARGYVPPRTPRGCLKPGYCTCRIQYYAFTCTYVRTIKPHVYSRHSGRLQ